MKIFPLFTAILACVVLSGCGYRLGSLGHPQLKSVAVAPVTNDTLTYNAAAHLRGLLSESFQTDGTMKLTDMKKADCIVYARITDTKFKAISWSSRSSKGEDSYQPNQWQVNMSVEYSVIIPGKAAPLIKNKTVKGSAQFMSGPDLEISRDYATRQAAFDAAKKIVSAITEAW